MPLLIKDLEINSITGPVSLSVLVPEPDLVNAVKRNVPIIMLFGDEHFSDTGYCSTCTCDLKTKNCCYEIWAKDFLQLFDSVATKEKPIDFYVEGFTNSQELEKARADIYKFSKEMAIASQSVGPMVSLRNHLYTCYLREFRGSKAYKELCPTSNIRWQFADSRQSKSGHIEGNLYIINGMFLEIARIANNRFLGLEDPNLPFQLMAEIVNQYIPIVGPGYSDYLELYIEFIRDPQQFFYILFDPDGPMFSKLVTYKQIKKHQFPFNSKHYWSNLFINYSKYIIDKYRFRLDNDYISAVIGLSNSKEPDTYFKNTKKTIWEKSIDYATILSIFLDIYFVTRILKKPEGGSEPFLVIGYFGKEHIANIEYLLENLMANYVNLGDINANSRCLHINPVIDLNKIAKVYNGDFTKTRSFLSKLLGK